MSFWQDRCQRMHWAIAEDYGDYPEAMPRRTSYYLDVPDEEAEACIAALTELGGEVSRHRVEDTVHSKGWLITAFFEDLPPDPSHHARVSQLSSLAHRHGGELTSFGI